MSYRILDGSSSSLGRSTSFLSFPPSSHEQEEEEKEKGNMTSFVSSSSSRLLRDGVGGEDVYEKETMKMGMGMVSEESDKISPLFFLSPFSYLSPPSPLSSPLSSSSFSSQKVKDEEGAGDGDSWKPIFPSKDDRWCSSSGTGSRGGIEGVEEEWWDGVDFGLCWERKYVTGIIPIVFTLLSLTFLLLALLNRLITFLRSYSSASPKPGKKSRRSSSLTSHGSSSRHRKPSSSSSSQVQSSSSLIWSAERKVIAECIRSEDLLDFGSEDGPKAATTKGIEGNGRKSSFASFASGSRRNGGGLVNGIGGADNEARSSSREPNERTALLPSVTNDLEDEDDDDDLPPVTWSLRLAAIRSMKKDTLVALFSTIIALLTLSILTSQARHESPMAFGSGWLALRTATTVYFAFLTIWKSMVSYSDKVERFRDGLHFINPDFTVLEWNVIPLIIVFSGVGFFEARTALLLTNEMMEQERRLWYSTWIFQILTLLLEILPKRPSEFGPRKGGEIKKRDNNDNSSAVGSAQTSTYSATTTPTKSSSVNNNDSSVSPRTRPPAPEIHASLLSRATFGFISPFIYRHARVSATQDDVPKLRPDDKTARVLQGYRDDTERLRPFPLWGFWRGKETRQREKASLVWKLFWHFRWELFFQQIFSYVRVLFTITPPLFLQSILGYLSQRNHKQPPGVRPIPWHVPFLYAILLFLSQIVCSMAAGQTLMMGRRICIRLRSILIGEVFAKVLRRKELAGKTATSDEKEGSEDASKSSERTKEQITNKSAFKNDEDDDEERASNGRISNLISVDTFRVSEVCAYLHFFWPEGGLTLVVAIWLLFSVIGLSAVAGLVVMIILVPTNAAISKLFYHFQNKLLKAADERLELATEVINSIKIVKYFAWETKFFEKMQETRVRELRALAWRSAISVVSCVVFSGAPICISLATFIFHTQVLHRSLDAETAFTSLALFNVIRGPMESLTDMLVSILQALVSVKRIDRLMEEEETAKYAPKPQRSLRDPVIGFSNATFTWSGTADSADTNKFKLKDLDFAFPQDKLSIIVGPVGSGKTTLLMSLLSETNGVSGQAFLPSPLIRTTGIDPTMAMVEATAYCSQSPWLLSDTIRENITFGSKFNVRRYKEVLTACALDVDVSVLELGDLTEVGEKGTVLSGGQKARISLARAVYSPAKYLLCDDVFSAVDSHTARHLYLNVLKGPLMEGRTCVLVTHQVDLVLGGCDFIVQLDNGSVVKAGHPAQVMSESYRPYTSTSEGSGGNESSQSTLAPDSSEAPAASESTIEMIAAGGQPEDLLELKRERERRDKLKLIKDETQATGSVSLKVYSLYLKAFGGLPVWLFCLFFFIALQVADIIMNLALRSWAAAYDPQNDGESASPIANRVSSAVIRSPNRSDPQENSTANYWLRQYLIWSIINIFFYGFRVGYFYWRGLIASKAIYLSLIHNILGARVRFFDSTPVGRILNRLSKDMETIDQDVASSFLFLSIEVFAALGTVAAIALVMPVFLWIGLFIIGSYLFIGYLYIASSRELKRTESVSRSPIFSLFGEALQGVTTIRAYGDMGRFFQRLVSLIDLNNGPFLTMWFNNRWLAFRVDVAGAIVALCTAIFVLTRTKMDAALGGFILSYSISFNERILWVVRLWSNVEINLNSVERIQEYMNIEQESKEGIEPPAHWPSRDGDIGVEKLTMKYAPELSPVLKQVSFNVKAGEKVGICGRTGSGKSTLALSFFRFIEAEKGRIVIDGLDASSILLTKLRERLTIIPQEAYLFRGTIRFNLDPFGLHQDYELWDALSRVGLSSSSGSNSRTISRRPSKTRLAGVPDDQGIPRSGSQLAPLNGDANAVENERHVVRSLEMKVEDGGKNFSAGQRQLLALARGLLKLRSSSILILDESTASLDHATDERIQRTIREEMGNATILCIAHRLKTIIDYDKILVLGEGQLLEFDTPHNLLQDEDSTFSNLCERSGEYDLLVRMAEEKHRNDVSRHS